MASQCLILSMKGEMSAEEAPSSLLAIRALVFAERFDTGAVVLQVGGHEPL
jgi:hypothetical protein